jgi:hypothetical protein
MKISLDFTSLLLEWLPSRTQTTAILWKTGHAKGRLPVREVRQKKEIKKVNMIDVLPIRE